MANKRRPYMGCVDNSHNVYTIDRAPARTHAKALHIRKFDRQGKFKYSNPLLTTGGTTSVMHSGGIAVDDHHNLYCLATYIGTTTVATGDTALIIKYDDELNPVIQAAVGAGSLGQVDYLDIDVDDTGHVYIFGGGTTTGSYTRIFDDELNLVLDFDTSTN